MTFARLRRGDWLAFVAALALLLVMSVNWYSTEAGEQAREDAAQTSPQGGPASTEAARGIDERAEIIANPAEKNAWQAGAFPDRLILFVLLATAALAIAAAFLRAANRRFEQPWTPSSLTTLFGLAAVLLLAARIVQKPSADPGAVIKAGAPIGLACVALVAIGARIAWKGEREEGGGSESPAAEHGAPEARADRTRPAPLFDHDDAGGAVATASRPVTVREPVAPAEDDPAASDPDWAPDWSDSAAPAEPEQAAAADEPRRGRRGLGRRRRPRGN